MKAIATILMMISTATCSAATYTLATGANEYATSCHFETGWCHTRTDIWNLNSSDLPIDLATQATLTLTPVNSVFAARMAELGVDGDDWAAPTRQSPVNNYLWTHVEAGPRLIRLSVHWRPTVEVADLFSVFEVDGGKTTRGEYALTFNLNHQGDLWTATDEWTTVVPEPWTIVLLLMAGAMWAVCRKGGSR